MIDFNCIGPGPAVMGHLNMGSDLEYGLDLDELLLRFSRLVKSNWLPIQSRNNPGFSTFILGHSEIWGRQMKQWRIKYSKKEKEKSPCQCLAVTVCTVHKGKSITIHFSTVNTGTVDLKPDLKACGC
jgi:hypothetical protein